MSRAASAVDTWARSGPARSAHPWANPRDVRAKASSSAASSGVGSAARKVSSWGSVRQSIGEDLSTPLGSNPTTS